MDGISADVREASLRSHGGGRGPWTDQLLEADGRRALQAPLVLYWARVALRVQPRHATDAVASACATVGSRPLWGGASWRLHASGARQVAGAPRFLGNTLPIASGGADARIAATFPRPLDTCAGAPPAKETVTTRSIASSSYDQQEIVCCPAHAPSTAPGQSERASIPSHSIRSQKAKQRTSLRLQWRAACGAAWVLAFQPPPAVALARARRRPIARAPSPVRTPTRARSPRHHLHRRSSQSRRMHHCR